MGKREWTEVVAPIVARCNLVATFDQQVCWNAKGAAAISAILTHMATIIDDEIDRREARPSLDLKAMLHE